jgi:hypothetical protein
MPETPGHHMGRKPVVLLPGLICNERGYDADDCDPACNDFEPICNDCEPEPKTQLQSICARLSDDCDPAAGCLQVITAMSVNRPRWVTPTGVGVNKNNK